MEKYRAVPTNIGITNCIMALKSNIQMKTVILYPESNDIVFYMYIDSQGYPL